MRRLPSLALALALALSGAAAARPLHTDEAAGLDKALRAYLGALARGDAGRIVAAMPPRIITMFAEQAGTDPAALQGTLAEQTAALMARSRFSEIGSSMPDEAGDATLADGAKVVWAVVPARFTVTTGSRKVQNEQPLLALREAGAWYFLRIEGAAQSQMVSLAYPFLADATFPAATATEVK